MLGLALLAHYGKALLTVLAVVSKECGFPAVRTIYLERQAARATPDLASLDGVSAFGAPLRPDGVDFSAEWTHVVVERNELSTVFTRMLVSWRLGSSFTPFLFVICTLSVKV